MINGPQIQRQQQVNNRRQNNIAQNNHQQQGQNAQNPPHVPVLRHPADSLAIQGSTISALSSTYRFSKEAIAALERSEDHLLITENDRTRFRIGGTHGYVNHQHALGATLRKTHHDEIIYGLAPTGRMLDVGSSPVRMFHRYQNGVSVLNRTHMMCPNVGVRDDFRISDNRRRLIDACEEHNKRQVTQPGFTLMDRNNGLLTPETATCNHLGGSDIAARGDCSCTHNYDTVTSVDSFYYPGVLEEVFDKVIGGANGFVVGNDYHHVNKDNTDKFPFLHFSSNKPKFDACVNYLNVPESTTTFSYTTTGIPQVTAKVQGNMMPYIHSIPNAYHKIFIHEYITQGTTWYMLFEEIKCSWNGSIPYKTWKVRASRADRWETDELEDIPIYKTRFLQMLDHSIVSKGFDIEEFKKTLPKITPVEEAPLTPFFDVEDYHHKVCRMTDATISIQDACKRKPQEWRFIDFIAKQFWRANRVHEFRIRQNNGEYYMMLTKLDSSWFGLIKSSNKGNTAQAKVSDIIDAYIKLGVKENTNSCLYTVVQAQREIKTPDETIFQVNEAYVIARYIRQEQKTRWEQILTA